LNKPNSIDADIEALKDKNSPESEYRVGIVGTFDVENYGDLLFPLIAQLQLKRRVDNIKVISFAPNAVSQYRPWPIEVNSTDSIKHFLPSLSALLIGGGQIVRFDRGYPIPVNSNINLPVDYWLSPAALGALLGKPVIWNAVGAWTGSPIPPWYTKVLKATLSASALVAVRDEPSYAHLYQVNPLAAMQRVPDTAFSLARLWPNEEFGTEYIAWCKNLKIEGPYIVVQADSFMMNYRDAIQKLLHDLAITTVVILPVCRCHGDSSDNFHAFICDNLVRSEWLSPLLTCEVISHAKFVLASSLHACITSICYGVTCIRVESFNSSDQKFEILDNFENICRLEETDRIRHLFFGGKTIDSRAVECADLLELYWNNVANIVTGWQTSNCANAMSIMLPWAMEVFRDMEFAGSQSQRKKWPF
jgi:polysaccharide pyruvyl transferase WcaK-like protein